MNWSGLETECRQFDGLDCTTAREYLDLLKAHGFNALQIPISTTMGLDVDGAPHKATSDPDLSGLSAGQALAKVIALAGERGIQVVLKMERVDETQPTPELWFDGRHSTEQVMQAWDTVLGRVKGAPNLMGVNLKGSPHGRASWGNSNSSYDWCVCGRRTHHDHVCSGMVLVLLWGVGSCLTPSDSPHRNPLTYRNKAAEQLANHIIQSHPDFKGLFFVEGVSEAGNVDAGPNGLCVCVLSMRALAPVVCVSRPLSSPRTHTHSHAKLTRAATPPGSAATCRACKITPSTCTATATSASWSVH